MSKFSDFIKKLTDDDINRMAEELAIEIKTNYVELESWYHSNRFTEVIEQVHQELKINKQITDDVYSEPLFGDVSNDEFVKLFQIAFDTSFNSNCIEKGLQDFEYQSVKFKKLKFTEIYGQGTLFIIENIGE